MCIVANYLLFRFFLSPQVQVDILDPGQHSARLPWHLLSLLHWLLLGCGEWNLLTRSHSLESNRWFHQTTVHRIWKVNTNLIWKFTYFQNDKSMRSCDIQQFALSLHFTDFPFFSRWIRKLYLFLRYFSSKPVLTIQSVTFLLVKLYSNSPVGSNTSDGSGPAAPVNTTKSFCRHSGPESHHFRYQRLLLCSTEYLKPGYLCNQDDTMVG